MALKSSTVATLCVLFSTLLTTLHASPADGYRACHVIARALPKVVVSYPGSKQFEADIHHWVPNAEQNSTCTVEPTSEADLGEILCIIQKTDSPFGVKCGGHSTSRGFSSTLGVHISLINFNQTTINKAANTVDLGAGLSFDKAYPILEKAGLGVAGGRVAGVGVSGYLLGGGYSWFSNRYGLSMDNVVGYQLVLPNGTSVGVTSTQNTDLFWGLKGGYNNFGVVTRFTMKTFTLGQVYGGLIVFPEASQQRVIAAIARYDANNTDKDAGMTATFAYKNGSAQVEVILVYNGQTPRTAVFNEILAIPSTTKDVKTRLFTEFVTTISEGFQQTGSQRFRFLLSSARATALTVPLLTKTAEQVKSYNTGPFVQRGGSIAAATEPFISSSITKDEPSAWPHANYLSPFGINVRWTRADDDQLALNRTDSFQAVIESAAKADGQKTESVFKYPNYSLWNAPLSQLYADNLGKLKQLAQKYDPSRLMTRAGGFKFQ